MSYWNNRRVVVSGGSGFLGAFVVERLRAAGCQEITVPRSREYDLREKSEALRLYKEARPDIFIHLAAVVGGIGANRANPGRFFYDNAAMGLHAIEAARTAGIEKFVCAGTICSYPKFTPVPFREENFWDGYPEETNAPYGLAEKYAKADLVNLGSGEEISIRDLLGQIRALVGYEGALRWDATKPDGQPRRCLDTSRALTEFGWRAKTPLRDGLRETIRWFESNTRLAMRA